MCRGGWQHTSEQSHSCYEAMKIAEEIFPPSLPLFAKEILSLRLSLSLSSMVQPVQFSSLSYPQSTVLHPIHPSIVIFGSTRRSSLESSFLHPHVYAASRPSPIILPPRSVAPVIYTLGKVVMPLRGKASPCLVSSSWLSWVYHVPYPRGPLSGCAMYPMLAVSFPSLG